MCEASVQPLEAFAVHYTMCGRGFMSYAEIGFRFRPIFGLNIGIYGEQFVCVIFELSEIFPRKCFVGMEHFEQFERRITIDR